VEGAKAAGAVDGEEEEPEKEVEEEEWAPPAGWEGWVRGRLAPEEFYYHHEDDPGTIVWAPPWLPGPPSEAPASLI
jgi:hypothetical protein